MVRWMAGLIAAILLATMPAAAMTKAQMQAVAAAITNAGYEAQAVPNLDGTTWIVRGSTVGGDTVAIAVVNNLAIAQGVTGFTPGVEFGPMDLAKMQAVMTAATNAGYQSHATLVSAGVWKVRVLAGTNLIPTADAAALATAQAVAGAVTIVEYR